MFENLYKDNPNYNFVIAHAEIDYLKPLYFEKIKIVCCVSNIGKTSFKKSQQSKLCLTPLKSKKLKLMKNSKIT